MDLDPEIDRLYQGPLASFTSARNALAAALKKDGQADQAEQVKALVKPSASAWAVNQVYWHARADWDALVEAGTAFRELQRALLSGGPVTEAQQVGERRAAALSQAVGRASDLAAGANAPLSPDLRQRVTATLDTVATYGRTPPASFPPPGRYVDDLAAPGFAALAGLVPAGEHLPAIRPAPSASASGAAGPATVTNLRIRRLAKAREEQAAAEADLVRAERRLEDVAREVSELEAQRERAGAEVTEARARLSELEAGLARIHAKLSQAVARRDEAAVVRDRAGKRAREATEAVAILERSS